MHALSYTKNGAEIFLSENCNENEYEMIYVRAFCSKRFEKLLHLFSFVEKVLRDVVEILAQNYSLVIKQKDESQKGGGKKTKQAKFSEKRLFLTPWYALCSFLCRFAHFHLTGTLLFSKQLSYKKGFRNTQRWSLLLDKWGGSHEDPLSKLFLRIVLTVVLTILARLSIFIDVNLLGEAEGSSIWY